MDRKPMLDILIGIASEASRAILSLYSSDFKTYTKEDRSPVTDADMASNTLITEMLGKHFSDIPVISEESPLPSFEQRKHWKRFFLVDPLDGTKGFIKKSGQFTVNIALVEDGTPSLGVVAVPVEESIYFAAKGEGAWCRTREEEDIRLPYVSEPEEALRVVVSASSNKATDQFVEALMLKYRQISVERMDSSLKICQVAGAHADIYPRLHPTSEWDTAAGHAILLETGGNIFNFSREPLVYNKESMINPPFLAQSGLHGP